MFVYHISRTVKVRNKPLAAQTLMRYAKAAEDWCATRLTEEVATRFAALTTVHPFISELVRHRRNWQQPRSKKEPVTQRMITAAHDMILARIDQNREFFLSREAAVHAWVRLGCFTGSRAGEYAQVRKKRGEIGRIPHTKDAGEWAGQPLAFLISDWTYWDHDNRQLTGSLSSIREKAQDVHILFRYDKSINNFSIRKFRRTGHPYLCPVLTSLEILFRAQLLNVRPDHPIGVFRMRAACKSRSKEGYDYLTNVDVTNEMRSFCLLAYPDPAHYMNQHYKCIMAHSNRVTAACALKAAGNSYETIAFRLRWTVDSVVHYIREAHENLDDLADSVVLGAGRL